jgi:hypothetical protein
MSRVRPEIVIDGRIYTHLLDGTSLVDPQNLGGTLVDPAGGDDNVWHQDGGVPKRHRDQVTTPLVAAIGRVVPAVEVALTCALGDGHQRAICRRRCSIPCGRQCRKPVDDSSVHMNLIA